MSMFFNNAQWYMRIFRQAALKGGCQMFVVHTNKSKFSKKYGSSMFSFASLHVFMRMHVCKTLLRDDSLISQIMISK